MTDKPEGEEPQQVFVPVTATQAAPAPESEEKKEKAPKKKDDKEFPVGQVAAGGAGATVLGSYALASVVGPWGWAAAPAAAVVGGAGYLAYRQRRKGSKERSTKTTVTRTRGSKSRSGALGGLRGGGLSGSGRGPGMSTSAKRTGGLPSPAGKSGAASGSGRGGGMFRPGASPRPGAGFSRGGGGWGAAGRRAGGGTTPRLGGTPRSGDGGGLFGRGSTGDTTTSKRKSTPPSGTSGRPGSSPRTPGGSMGKNRWGGTSAPTSDKPPGRVRRGAAKARDWADDKTGRRMSTGWRAARGETGFKARRRAAGAAVRDAGGGGFIAWIVGLVAALGAGLASLFGRSSKDKAEGGKPTAGTEEPAAEEKATATGSGPDGKEPASSRGLDYDPNEPGGPKHGSRDFGPPGVMHDSCIFDPSCTCPKHASTTTSSTATTGGTTMSGLPAAQIAHDMAGAMARYEPADAYQVVPDSRQWEDVPTQVAFAVKAYADRLEGARFPINGAINDKLREFAQALAATRSIAEEIEPLIRKAHAEDLARKDSPRGDESKWNI